MPAHPVGAGPLAPVVVAAVKSVNVGRLAPNPAKDVPTAIDKQPTAAHVWVRAPGVARGVSGLQGDAVGDKAHHGGDDQAVYAFAREDLDYWETFLGRELRDGWFGENLTTVGLDPNEARLGERWQVGGQLVLQVAGPRIPCRTFAAHMAREGWARQFSEQARPGAYLKVLEPGPVTAGDPISIQHRPAHAVTVSMALQAFTLKPSLLSSLLQAGDDLSEKMRSEVMAGLS